MTVYLIIVVFALAFNFVSGSLLPYTYVEHERRDLEGPSHWVKKARLSKDITFPVRIGLTQGGLDRGHDLLMDISDPASPNYGRHYTAEQITDIFAPPDDRIQAVRVWLESQGGIHGSRISHSKSKQWLHFDASTAELESLLHTEYYHFEHSFDGRSGVACDLYHLPKHIQEHIDFITPGIGILEYENNRRLGKRYETEPQRRPHLGQPINESFAKKKKKTCVDRITPGCVRRLYNITDKVSLNERPQLGIYESFGSILQPRVLDSYFRHFSPEIPQGSRPHFIAVNGAPRPGYRPTKVPDYNASMFDGESNLDFQTSYPFLYPNKLVNFQVNDKYYEFKGRFIGLLNTFLDAIDGTYCNYTAFGITGDTHRLSRSQSSRMGKVHIDPPYPDKHKQGYKHSEQCGRYTPPPVISISYTEGEATLPINYQRRQCSEFMKLGLRGITILNASGDRGVSEHFGYVFDKLCLGKHGRIFGPNYPVNCPYITAVGSTVLDKGGKEKATTSFGSGGGFSNIYSRPSYQDAALEEYFSKHTPPYPSYRTNLSQAIGAHGGRYNRAGRGYPDVAAFGQRYIGMISETNKFLFSGTSVSTPLFASLIARINSARLAAGKSTVGFINPVLYAHPHAFNDVFRGNNPGCKSKGFEAVRGWDPVTGLGTPNYGRLKDVFMRLP